MQFQTNQSLRNFNTFNVDVKAKLFAAYNSVDELMEIIQSDEFQTNRHLHIGGGSNLLFLNDFDGLILHSKIDDIEIIFENDEELILRVGAGTNWDELVAYAVQNKYYGIENLSLIPGEVGAAAVQNIGAYGVEIKDHIESVEYIDIETKKLEVLSKPACQYSYRNSIFKNELKGKAIITHVNLRLKKSEQYILNYAHLHEAVLERGALNLENVRKTIIEIRQSKLPNPAKLGNAGSFFMNPVVNRASFENIQQNYPNMPFYKLTEDSIKIPAAWLIDQCGFKAKRFGNVGVYEKQALVIVNYGNATGREIADLSAQIQSKVKSKFGIDLNPEVNFIYS